MTRQVASQQVLPTNEVRSDLSAITAAFRKEGATGGIVIFGAYRRPQAAVIPYELVELLDPVIEDLVISLRVRDRLSQDDGGRRSLAEVAADLGVDLNER